MHTRKLGTRVELIERLNKDDEMNVLQFNRDRQANTAGQSDFLDIETIRRRVAKIKAGWSPATAKARAAEGARRRMELENLMLDRLTDVSGSEETCNLANHGFSLVG